MPPDEECPQPQLEPPSPPADGAVATDMEDDWSEFARAFESLGPRRLTTLAQYLKERYAAR